MRVLASLLFVFLISNSFAQTATDQWVSLKDGIDYKWVSKKKVNDTEYSILKLKVRNYSSVPKQVQFIIYEYKGVTPIAHSDEESFCLKPGLMDVIKVQMLSTNQDDIVNDVLLEFTDLSITEIESCSGK